MGIICKSILKAALVLAVLGLSGFTDAAKRDLDYERLQALLTELRQDPALGQRATKEITAAEAALQTLLQSRGNKKIRNHLIYLAERRIDIAYTAAQTEELQQRLVQLEREKNQILLEASRRDAEQARLEAEKQRLQSLAQSEELERLRAETENLRQESSTQRAEAVQREDEHVQQRIAEAQAKQADLARKEALLAQEAAELQRSSTIDSEHSSEKATTRIVLDSAAFVVAKASLTVEGKIHIANVIELAKIDKTQSVRLVSYKNRREVNESSSVLIQQRVETVKEALIAGGIASSRIRTIELDEEQAVISNNTKEKMAKNDEVEIFLEIGKMENSF